MTRSMVNVRAALEQDIVRITAIYKQAVEETNASWEWQAPSETDMFDRWQKTTAENYPYLVAELDGQIAGYAYAGAFRGRKAYQWTVEDSVYVDPASVGRGVGAALLNALIDHCTLRGYRQMVAVIASSENEVSQQLHRKFGFQHIGTMKDIGWKNGEWHDWILMSCPLGEGGDSPACQLTGRSDD